MMDWARAIVILVALAGGYWKIDEKIDGYRKESDQKWMQTNKEIIDANKQMGNLQGRMGKLGEQIKDVNNRIEKLDEKYDQKIGKIDEKIDGYRKESDQKWVMTIQKDMNKEEGK